MTNKTYIQNLREKTSSLSFFEQQAGRRLSPIKKAKPLTDQITDLINSLPSNLANRPWSMSEFVSRLEGKYKARPHPQKIAEALRVLGWKRMRYWEKGFDGARVWLPRKSQTIIE